MLKYMTIQGKQFFFKVSIWMNRGENSGAKKIISILSSIFLR